MSGHPQPANALGALALVVTDRATAIAAEAAGQSLSGAAVLSAMGQFLDGVTIDRLRELVGLTSSGMVRLVDRLQDAGLVSRGSSTSDGRSRSVNLTARGREVAGEVRAARLAYLDALVEPLSAEETEMLGRLLAKLTTAVVEEKNGGAWACRLCDLEACGQSQHRCPVDNADRAKRGWPAWDWEPQSRPADPGPAD